VISDHCIALTDMYRRSARFVAAGTTLDLGNLPWLLGLPSLE
jgi:hypothetical protein